MPSMTVCAQLVNLFIHLCDTQCVTKNLDKVEE